MDSTLDTRGQTRMSQFKDISDTDKNVIRRLTADRHQKRSGNTDNIDTAPIANVFRRTLRDATDIRNIFQTMPDLHLPREILISAIVSPGDLTQTSLIFGNEMPKCESAILSPLTQALETFFVGQRKIETKVAGWIDDALIWSGAHPILIIPEATLDRLILGDDAASMESISSYGGEFVNGWYKPKGIFGIALPTPTGESYVSLESAKHRINTAGMAEYHTIKVPRGQTSIELPFRVTDNMAVLRTPVVQKMKRGRVMESAYGTPSLESRRRQRAADKQAKDGESNSSIHNKFFRQPQQVLRSRLQVVPTGKQAGGKNMGHPLEYHLATEAVMPVCVPGDETNHVGYIILLDANGYPISYSRRLNYYDDVRRGGGQDGSSSAVAGELINMSKDAIAGGISNASNGQIDRLADLHAEIVEADIVSRLKAGMLGGDFEISHSEHVDRLMFARSMRNQLTTMLYIPAELMIYMAYEFNEYGIGKSILEDAKSLAAMRAAVTVANVIGATKNAIPGKDINIELDPDDGDPVGTATFMANEALGLAYHQFPMSISSTVGLAEQLQLSSFSVNVTGNPRYPEVKTSIGPRESSYSQIDTELQQTLRDDLTRVFGLTPEMVDSVNQPDFATTAVQNSLMLMKRVMVIQGKTNPMLTDYVRLFTYNSGILVDQLIDLIEQNSKYLPDEYKDDPEGFLEEFLNNLTVKLPAPESDNLTKQMELFNNFSETLDKALPAYIREEYFDGYSPEKIKEALPTVVESWKGVILRSWMRKRGILRELDIFNSTEDGSPMMNLTDEMSNHIESVMKSVGGYAKRVAHDSLKRKVTTAKTIAEVDKATKMLAEFEAEPDDKMNGDDTFGGGQDLAAGNEPTNEPQLDENGNEIETDASAGNGADEFSMDLDAPPGDDSAAGAEQTPGGEPATASTEEPAATDELNINLDEPAADANAEPEAPATEPAETGDAEKPADDLDIQLDEPVVTEDTPADKPADDAATKPEDLEINLDEPKAGKDEGEEEGDGKEKPGKDKDVDGDDLKIDLGTPAKPKK